MLEKTEDSFIKYYKKANKFKTERKKIFIYKGKKYKNQTRFMECHLDVKKVLKIAHSYNTTLTGLLTAVLIYSFKDELKLSDINKSIKIDIPVDLRNYFKSYSSLNFIALTSITYKFTSKDDTLENIIHEVNKQFKDNFTEEKISDKVNSLVAFEKNFFCKFSPFYIKNIIFNIIKKITSKMRSTCLSNIGIIKLDAEIEERITSISVLVATDDFQFSACTLKNDLCIGISSKYFHNDVIKNFCRCFSSRGLNVRIDGNEVE